jgi:hypothetical protein
MMRLFNPDNKLVKLPEETLLLGQKDKLTQQLVGDLKPLSRSDALRKFLPAISTKTHDVLTTCLIGKIGEIMPLIDRTTLEMDFPNRWTLTHAIVVNPTLPNFQKQMILKAIFFLDDTQVSSQNAEGISPLLLAVMINDTTMVETLLEAGAMVDLCDYKGKSPIMYAISNSQLYIASLLYYYHASILNPTVSLYTIACHSKFPEGTKALLKELINKEHHQDVIKKAAGSKKQKRIDSNKYANSNLTHGKKVKNRQKTPSIFVAPV